MRGHHYKLPAPFFVLATQNPIELEGTYPLPEAQLDRFLFNAILDYLSADDELKVVDLTTATRDVKVAPVTTAEDLLDFQQLVRMVPIADTAGALCRKSGARHAAQERQRAGLREEVCQLRRQRARGAVHCAGGQGARALAQALSRNLRRHRFGGCSRPAPPHSAQLPRGVGPHRRGRNSSTSCIAQMPQARRRV